MRAAGSPPEPVTGQNCHRLPGPFFHGTAAAVPTGATLRLGYASHFEAGRRLHHVYFTTVLETAVWAAELATALSGSAGRGRVYEVAPLGPFEDDPNVTNKRAAGNPTGSYRSRDPLQVVGEVTDWTGHEPAELARMLDALAALRARGLAVIED